MSFGPAAHRRPPPAVRPGRDRRGDHRAARHPEELGFADVWVSDHTVHPASQDYPSPCLSARSRRSLGAAVTERVGLGTSVLVVPSHGRWPWPTRSPASTTCGRPRVARAASAGPRPSTGARASTPNVVAARRGPRPVPGGLGRRPRDLRRRVHPARRHPGAAQPHAIPIWIAGGPTTATPRRRQGRRLPAHRGDPRRGGADRGPAARASTRAPSSRSRYAGTRTRRTWTRAPWDDVPRTPTPASRPSSRDVAIDLTPGWARWIAWPSS